MEYIYVSREDDKNVIAEKIGYRLHDLYLSDANQGRWMCELIQN